MIFPRDTRASTLTGVNARIGAPFSGRYWRLRRVEDINLELGTGAPGSADALFRDAVPMEIRFTLGNAACSFTVPEVALDRLLHRVPTLGAWTGLEPDVIALVLDHTLSSSLKQIETRLGMPCVIEAVEKRVSQRQYDEIPLSLTLDATAYPASLLIRDRAVLTALGEAISEIEAAGPGGVAGMPVMIGPIRLAHGDIGLLDAGDQLLLEDASLEKLTGVVQFQPGLGWPMDVIEGHAVITGAITELPARDRSANLYLRVGALLQPSAMKIGDRIPMAKASEAETILSLGDKPLCRAGLIATPQGLAVKIISKEIAS